MKPDTFPSSISAAAVTSAWMSAYMQPLAAWQGWTQLMGDQWQQWIKAMGAAPNPWLPALAAGGKGQNASIEFFLPWFPRVDAAFKPFDTHGADMAARLMMRAAWPQLGALQPSGSRSDAEVQMASSVEKKPAQAAVIIEVAPAKSAPVRKSRAKAVAKPVAAPKLEAVKTTPAKAVPAKAAAAKPASAEPPKPSARRVRKPAAPKPAADKA